MSNNKKYFYDRDENIINKEEFYFDVLPHPYFGDINNADIIFLAKNPSYDKNDDEYDTFIYEELFKLSNENETFDWEKHQQKYDEALKKVNYFDDFKSENNRTFFNAWKWWNKNVIGNNIELNEKLYGTKEKYKVAFVNLCGYHSKEYVDVYNNLNDKIPWYGCNVETMDSLLNKIKEGKTYLVIVWGKNEWSKLMKKFDDSYSGNNECYFENKFNKKQFIVLNQKEKQINNGKIKCNRNIKTIENIITSKYNFYDNNVLEGLKTYFTLKPKE